MLYLSWHSVTYQLLFFLVLFFLWYLLRWSHFCLTLTVDSFTSPQFFILNFYITVTCIKLFHSVSEVITVVSYSCLSETMTLHFSTATFSRLLSHTWLNSFTIFLQLSVHSWQMKLLHSHSDVLEPSVSRASSPLLPLFRKGNHFRSRKDRVVCLLLWNDSF